LGIAVETLTLPEFYRRQYRPTQLLGCARATLAQYEVALSHYNASGDGLPISSLTEIHLAAVVRHVLGRGSSPATANKVLRHLMAILRFARRKHLIRHLPRIRKLREPERLPEAWRLEEITAILEAAKAEPGAVASIPAGAYWESLLLACYDSGGRIGAVSAMRPMDVDLGHGWAKLCAENQKQSRDQFFQLDDQTVRAIGRIWDRERPLLWPWPFGRNALYDHFRKILKRAGVSYGQMHGGLFHKVRRTSGSLVEANGGDGSRQLGNSRAVFLKHYWDPRIAPRSQFSLLPRPQLAD